MATATPELQFFSVLTKGLREIAETVQLSEVVNLTLPERSISESLQLSEEEVDMLFREIQESIQFSEIVSVIVITTPVLFSFWLNSTSLESTDTIILSENIELKYGTLNLSESILFSEEIQGEGFKNVEISEIIFQSETLSVGSANLLPEELFDFSEELEANVIRTNQESILFSEKLVVLPSFITEVVKLKESISRKFPLPQIEEVFSLSESVLNQIPRSYDEEIRLAEEIEFVLSRVTPIDELMNFTEQWETKQNPTDETLKFTELIELYKNLVEKEINETFRFGETVQSQIKQTISEVFNFSEETTIAFSGSVQVSESIEFVEEINRNRITPSELFNLAETIQEKITENLSDLLRISEIVDANIIKHPGITDQFFFAENLEFLRIWILEIEEDLDIQEFITKTIYKHIGPDVSVEIQLFEDLVFSEVLERYIMIEPISEEFIFSETIELPIQTKLIAELINFSEEIAYSSKPVGKDSARLRFGGKKKKFAHLRKEGG